MPGSLEISSVEHVISPSSERIRSYFPKHVYSREFLLSVASNPACQPLPGGLSLDDIQVIFEVRTAEMTIPVPHSLDSKRDLASQGRSPQDPPGWRRGDSWRAGSSSSVGAGGSGFLGRPRGRAQHQQESSNGSTASSISPSPPSSASHAKVGSWETVRSQRDNLASDGSPPGGGSIRGRWEPREGRRGAGFRVPGRGSDHPPPPPLPHPHPPPAAAKPFLSLRPAWSSTASASASAAASGPLEEVTHRDQKKGEREEEKASAESTASSWHSSSHGRGKQESLEQQSWLDASSNSQSGRGAEEERRRREEFERMRAAQAEQRKQKERKKREMEEKEAMGQNAEEEGAEDADDSLWDPLSFSAEDPPALPPPASAPVRASEGAPPGFTHKITPLSKRESCGRGQGEERDKDMAAALNSQVSLSAAAVPETRALMAARDEANMSEVKEEKEKTSQLPWMRLEDLEEQLMGNLPAPLPPPLPAFPPTSSVPPPAAPTHPMMRLEDIENSILLQHCVELQEQKQEEAGQQQKQEPASASASQHLMSLFQNATLGNGSSNDSSHGIEDNKLNAGLAKAVKEEDIVGRVESLQTEMSMSSEEKENRKSITRAFAEEQSMEEKKEWEEAEGKLSGSHILGLLGQLSSKLQMKDSEKEKQMHLGPTPVRTDMGMEGRVVSQQPLNSTPWAPFGIAGESAMAGVPTKGPSTADAVPPHQQQQRGPVPEAPWNGGGLYLEASRVHSSYRPQGVPEFHGGYFPANQQRFVSSGNGLPNAFLHGFRPPPVHYNMTQPPIKGFLPHSHPWPQPPQYGSQPFFGQQVNYTRGDHANSARFIGDRGSDGLNHWFGANQAGTLHGQALGGAPLPKLQPQLPPQAIGLEELERQLMAS